jgi:hypothetical protein
MLPTSSSHPNSHRVTIFRNPSFLSGAQDKEVQAYLATGNESVGSYFESRNSTIIGSGLTIDEKRYLLPDLLGISHEDRTFIEKVNEYYAGMDTPIPYENGKELEIGMQNDNGKPLFIKDPNGKITFNGEKYSFKQMPINLADYIRYRQIKGHPKVAGSREEAEGNQTKDYYIFDPLVAETVGIAKQDLADEALTIYLGIVGGADAATKIDQMLTLLGKDPRDVGTASERKSTLKKMSEATPKKFVDTYKDENFELKYWVLAFIHAGVWNRAGTSRIIEKESSKLIGNNMQEALAWMQDKENDELIGVYKSKVQDAMKVRRRNAQSNKIVRT